MTSEDGSKTLFILGAGASCDFGFPSNEGLKKDVAKFYQTPGCIEAVKRIIWNSRDYIKQANLYESLPDPISNHLRSNSSYPYNGNENVYSEWINTLHAFQTIDDFVFARKKYSLLAKIGVFFCISIHEDAKLFKANPHTGFETTWYNKFWDYLTENIYTYDDFRELCNKIRIITFNYDRSLDYFLLEFAKSKFDKKDLNPVDLPIDHVYGGLGKLGPAFGPDINPYFPLISNAIPEEQYFKVQLRNPIYGDNNDFEAFRIFDNHVFKLASQLITFSEKTDVEFKRKIKSYVYESQRIYFFGFSFHKQNMEILFGGETVYGAKIETDGTCYLMPIYQIDKVRKDFFNRVSGKYDFLAEKNRETNVKKFMDEYSIRID